jgi:hypothetical protein
LLTSTWLGVNGTGKRIMARKEAGLLLFITLVIPDLIGNPAKQVCLNSQRLDYRVEPDNDN